MNDYRQHDWHNRPRILDWLAICVICFFQIVAVILFFGWLYSDDIESDLLFFITGLSLSVWTGFSVFAGSDIADRLDDMEDALLSRDANIVLMIVILWDVFCFMSGRTIKIRIAELLFMVLLSTFFSGKAIYRIITERK